MPNQPGCVGGCGRRVAGYGQICPSCQVMPVLDHVPTSSIRQIRFDILNAAYRLAFGTEDEKVTALEQLSHLTFVLQHQEKDTQ